MVGVNKVGTGARAFAGPPYVRRQDRHRAGVLAQAAAI
jgi:hypothetical protein